MIDPAISEYRAAFALNVRTVSEVFFTPDPRTWKDAAGSRWTMGHVTPDGAIVGEPGTFITAGVVYIDKAQLRAAIRAGWEQVDDIAPNGLTKVSRA
jgi:hypothetical protein